MNCDFCQQRLELYVLGELDPSVAQSIAEHLEGGCVACGEEFAGLNESIDCLIEDTELRSPESSTWEKVAAAIESDQPPGGLSHEVANQVGLAMSSRFTAKQIAAGVLAVACGFGLMLLTLRATIDPALDDRAASDLASADPSPPLKSDLAGEAAFKKSLDSTQLVSFREPNQPGRATGSMVVDFDARQLHVHVEMRDTHDYTLWFVTTSGEWISGGRLDHLSNNHYGKVIDIPVTKSPIAHTAIAIESSDATRSFERNVALVSDTISGLKGKSL
ncbi:anti-sigma factor [Rubripirellula reticaptiva]|uniref:Zinc-finger domain-containing protein n=1 Tax=Rubripirellula reticaptiva TaxID=2528013 RepID=A0A5C6EGE7_9BACT|nr:zf-HC2 domain-containing protein [Rubripirellula reticaptiva]TWU46646.1 hypothetical protein Poly59_56190 [Rubripirellula reticaptiva]